MNLTRRRVTSLAVAGTSLLRDGVLRADDLPLVELLQVKARRKPDQEWHEYPTRTLDRVAGFHPGTRSVKTGIYGGRTDRQQAASGFFRTSKTGSRWYLIDPDGNPYIQAGICSLTTGKSANNLKNLKAKFGTSEKSAAQTWAARTSELLRANGFSGSGGWSDNDVLRTVPNRLAYTTMNNFMGDFGRSRHITHQQAGHLGYPNDCIPVFHPDFEASCDKTARALSATKDDPFLLGHFLDNELPAPEDLLDRHLKLDSADPGRIAAEEWLTQRRTAGISGADREAFRGFVFARYFKLTSNAIRKHDSSHLCLGSRMHGPFLNSPAIMRAAGNYVDVVCVNVYNYWAPPSDLMAMWTAQSGKPFIVTEWYTKGEDSGYPNTSGAGWNVPTQRDRGWFYQNFSIALLESKNCVGWHWFKYLDNDPEDMTTDPSNRDSNKGLVNLRYEPYPDLLAAMNSLNANVYALADHFDR